MICGNKQIALMVSKFKVVRFDGTRKIRLWQTIVKDLLAQRGISTVLNLKKLAKLEDEKWEENDKVVFFQLDHVLCHG
jgi:16S rRNA U1498 N3-methylase RsmE